MKDGFDARKYRLWGLLPIIVTIWHGIHTIRHLSADHLLFVCYTANLLLGIGILIRSGLLIGTGFGWCVIAFPLWLYDTILHSDWEFGCALFHVCGLMVGAMGIRSYRLPKHTWAFAVSVAVGLQMLSRVFTNPSLNINAAFRVYDGWESIFPNYAVYWCVSVAGFAMFFMLLTFLSNRHVLGNVG